MSSLKKNATNIRKNLLNMCYRAKSSHIASGLSCVEILTTLYLGKILKIDPKNPTSSDRDYFVISKGHASAVFYATLSEAGFFPESMLDSYYQDGSKLPGHPTKGFLPGIEVSTGSLGHGLGLGAGLALGFSIDKRPNRAFVLISDGEMDEGSTWEAILFAGARKLSNLIVILDYNKIQSFGTVEEVLTLEPLEQKLKSFNWEVIRLNGNSLEELYKTLSSSSFMKSVKPKFIIADTIKGCGISFMENKLEWHYKSPDDNQYQDAMLELSK